MTRLVLLTLLGTTVQTHGSGHRAVRSRTKAAGRPLPVTFRADVVRYWVRLQQSGTVPRRRSVSSHLTWQVLPRHHPPVTSCPALPEDHVASSPTEPLPGPLMQEQGPLGLQLPAPQGSSHWSSTAPQGTPTARARVTEGCVKYPQGTVVVGELSGKNGEFRFLGRNIRPPSCGGSTSPQGARPLPEAAPPSFWLRRAAADLRPRHQTEVALRGLWRAVDSSMISKPTRSLFGSWLPCHPWPVTSGVPAPRPEGVRATGHSPDLILEVPARQGPRKSREQEKA